MLKLKEIIGEIRKKHRPGEIVDDEILFDNQSSRAYWIPVVPELNKMSIKEIIDVIGDDIRGFLFMCWLPGDYHPLDRKIVREIPNQTDLRATILMVVDDLWIIDALAKQWGYQREVIETGLKIIKERKLFHSCHSFVSFAFACGDPDRFLYGSRYNRYHYPTAEEPIDPGWLVKPYIKALAQVAREVDKPRLVGEYLLEEQEKGSLGGYELLHNFSQLMSVIRPRDLLNGLAYIYSHQPGEFKGIGGVFYVLVHYGVFPDETITSFLEDLAREGAALLFAKVWEMFKEYEMPNRLLDQATIGGDPEILEKVLNWSIIDGDIKKRLKSTDLDCESFYNVLRSQRPMESLKVLFEHREVFPDPVKKTRSALQAAKQYLPQALIDEVVKFVDAQKE